MSNSNTRLLIAGRVFGINNYESKLEELTKGNFRIKLFLDFIPDKDIQVFLNACDIFVLPYKDITTSGAALFGHVVWTATHCSGYYFVSRDYYTRNRDFIQHK